MYQPGLQAKIIIRRGKEASGYSPDLSGTTAEAEQVISLVKTAELSPFVHEHAEHLRFIDPAHVQHAQS